MPHSYQSVVVELECEGDHEKLRHACPDKSSEARPQKSIKSRPTHSHIQNLENTFKGWLAIAKLEPLSLFISLFYHCAFNVPSHWKWWSPWGIFTWCSISGEQVLLHDCWRLQYYWRFATVLVFTKRRSSHTHNYSMVVFFYLEREGSLCIDTTFLQLRNNRAQKTIQSIHKRSKHHPTTSDMAWAICGFEYNLLQSSGRTDVVHDNEWSTHVRFNHWPGLWRDPCWLGFQIIWNK